MPTIILLGVMALCGLFWIAPDWEHRVLLGLATVLVGTYVLLLLKRYSTLQQQVAERTVALQGSEARFRQVIASISDHIYVMGKREGGGWQNLYQSPNMRALTGYPQERFAEDGMLWPSLIHPEDVGRAAAQLARYDQGEDSEVEYRLRHADGHIIWVRDSGHVEKDDPLPGALTAYGVISDITARKVAEMERARFTAQLRTAAELSEHLSAILDPANLLRESATLLHTCFALCRVAIYLPDEQQQSLMIQAGGGLDEAEQRPIPLEDEQSAVAQAARRLKALFLDHSTTDTPLALPPGTVAEAALPLIAQGKLIGVLDVQENEPGRLTRTDLDVFSTIAGQLATALQNARLFQESQENARRLRELDRLKSEFLASMSHELRTPLNAIIGYTEVLRMGISGPISDPVREDIDAIRSSGLYLLRLIDDILDLSKIEAGRLALKREPVGVAELLEKVRANNEALLYQKPIELVVEMERDLPPIDADPLRLSQVLSNLLSNAVKFTEAGYIWLRASRSKGWLSIVVQDTGVGIPPESLEHIFEGFRQVDGSHARRAGGSGLGLAISRHLVELHGGQITVESEVGQGSTFTVRLPYGEQSM